MYVKVWKWELWLEILDNRQWWYNYDSRSRAYILRFGRLYMTYNRRKYA